MAAVNLWLLFFFLFRASYLPSRTLVHVRTFAGRFAAGFDDVCSRISLNEKDHQFMGEESTFEETGGGEAADADTIGTSPTWVIDPLDGTTNFVHGYPLFCVSIALAVDG